MVRADDDQAGRPPIDRRQPFQELRADGRRMLTVEQAARFMNCTAYIVRRLIADGDLHAVKYSPRNTRISERALAAFLDRGIVGPRRAVVRPSPSK